MRAWMTELIGVHSIVLAQTRGKARAATLAAAREAGFEVGFLDPIRVVRAKEFDRANVIPGQCWDPEVLKRKELPCSSS